MQNNQNRYSYNREEIRARAAARRLRRKPKPKPGQSRFVTGLLLAGIVLGMYKLGMLYWQKPHPVVEEEVAVEVHATDLERAALRQAFRHDWLVNRNSLTANFAEVQNGAEYVLDGHQLNLEFNRNPPDVIPVLPTFKVAQDDTGSETRLKKYLMPQCRTQSFHDDFTRCTGWVTRSIDVGTNYATMANSLEAYLLRFAGFSPEQNKQLEDLVSGFNFLVNYPSYVTWDLLTKLDKLFEVESLNLVSLSEQRSAALRLASADGTLQPRDQAVITNLRRAGTGDSAANPFSQRKLATTNQEVDQVIAFQRSPELADNYISVFDAAVSEVNQTFTAINEQRYQEEMRIYYLLPEVPAVREQALKASTKAVETNVKTLVNSMLSRDVVSSLFARAEEAQLYFHHKVRLVYALVAAKTLAALEAQDMLLTAKCSTNCPAPVLQAQGQLAETINAQRLLKIKLADFSYKKLMLDHPLLNPNGKANLRKYIQANMKAISQLFVPDGRF